MFWGEKPIFDSDPGQLAPGTAIESLKATDAAIAALDPRTPLQKELGGAMAAMSDRLSGAMAFKALQPLDALTS